MHTLRTPLSKLHYPECLTTITQPRVPLVQSEADACCCPTDVSYSLIAEERNSRGAVFHVSEQQVEAAQVDNVGAQQTGHIRHLQAAALRSYQQGERLQHYTHTQTVLSPTRKSTTSLTRRTLTNTAAPFNHRLIHVCHAGNCVVLKSR